MLDSNRRSGRASWPSIWRGWAASAAAAAAEGLLARGAARVLVTDGGRGCAEGTRGLGVIAGTPPRVMVTRVTGAGDTFMAAHIVAERRGADRQAALEAAMQAAAIYVSGEMPE